MRRVFFLVVSEHVSDIHARHTTCTGCNGTHLRCGAINTYLRVDDMLAQGDIRTTHDKFGIVLCGQRTIASWRCQEGIADVSHQAEQFVENARHEKASGNLCE